LAERFGSQCVVLSIDAAHRIHGPENTDHFEVVTHGGRRPRGIDAIAWAREGVGRGAGEILLTSIDRAGTRDGYDLPLLRAMTRAVTVPVIASGGAGTPEHMDAALSAGAAAVLAASIFHQGTYRIAEVKRFLAARGHPMRLAETRPEDQPTQAPGEPS
jgi:cyclase